jgi:hypothetical protein
MVTAWMSLLADGWADGALRGALIGAAVGGAIGFVVWITRRSRGDRS